MHDNQQAFLDAVRVALGKPAVREENAEDFFTSQADDDLGGLLERPVRTHGEQLELLAILKQTAVPLNLQVHEAASLAEAADGIVAIARATDTEWGGAKRITRHDTPLLDRLDLESRLDDIPVDVSRLEPGEDEAEGKQRLREQAEAAYIGLTGGNWCAVDCGALALLSGPGQGRATSLVPSVHIAVLTLEQLVPDLSEIYAHLKALGKLPTAVTFISGPSKTADIEATLVHGAHGPREMHVFVVTG